MKQPPDNLLKKTKHEAPEDLMAITKVIGPLIDKTVNEIFITHKNELLAKPITHIVPAVWGAKLGGELTDEQKAIHNKILPVIKEIFAALDLKGLDKSQEFTIGYLLRSLFVAKITYMIEALKNQINLKEEAARTLEQVKPAGNA
ncbi:MAG: hypothetical protein JRI34_05845 [Deltaproteobacteria bacterium]|nr:hypothetical protein [Deltaproteobacteria bacterium]